YYFDRRRRLLGLALTSVIDETNEYIGTLNDLIWEICNEYTWALPAHLPVGVKAVQQSTWQPEEQVDLFAAETAHALAETLTMLGDRLSPWMEYRIRTEIERRIFGPMFNSSIHFKWESKPSNWSAVCAGAVGMVALMLET